MLVSDNFSSLFTPITAITPLNCCFLHFALFFLDSNHSDFCCSDIANYFGDGCTPKALTHQVAALKSTGAVLKQAYLNGDDPFKIDLNLKPSVQGASKGKPKPKNTKKIDNDEGEDDGQRLFHFIFSSYRHTAHITHHLPTCFVTLF